ncbi:hypothetical protein B0H12DRAFT_96983 [Mycena haematopus]|nr:hypothetical protein B0H12DRAFT_96983 [Mycena haematopus]
MGKARIARAQQEQRRYYTSPPAAVSPLHIVASILIYFLLSLSHPFYFHLQSPVTDSGLLPWISISFLSLPCYNSPSVSAALPSCNNSVSSGCRYLPPSRSNGCRSISSMPDRTLYQPEAFVPSSSVSAHWHGHSLRAAVAAYGWMVLIRDDIL